MSNSWSLVDRGCVFCSSILMCCLVILQFNRKVFAFVQTKKGYEIVFCDWLWRCVGCGAPVSPKLLVLNDICHKSVSLICYYDKYSYCADMVYVSIIDALSGDRIIKSPVCFTADLGTNENCILPCFVYCYYSIHLLHQTAQLSQPPNS